MSALALDDVDSVSEPLANAASTIIKLVSGRGQRAHVVTALREQLRVLDEVAGEAEAIARESRSGVDALPPDMAPADAARLAAHLRGLLARNGALAAEASLSAVRTLAGGGPFGATGEAADLLTATLNALTRTRRACEDMERALFDGLERLAVAEALADPAPARPAADVFAELGWTAADAAG